MTIEFAAAGSERYIETVVDRAPAWVRTAINRNRIARGLRPVLGTAAHRAIEAAAATARAAAEAAEGRRVGVWLDNGGDLIPVTSSTSPRPAGTAPRPSSSRITTSRTASRQGGRGPILQARVLIMPVYGRAAARDVGRDLDERVAPGAFGDAATLNTAGSWSLLAGGHEGILLAMTGDTLRAIDTPAGLVVAWDPDMSKAWHRDVVRDLAEGHRTVSVMMRAIQRRTVRLPDLHELVTSAQLQHIALLQRSGARPCYPAARALVIRGAYRDDADELRRHIDKLVSECRFQAHRLGQ